MLVSPDSLCEPRRDPNDSLLGFPPQFLFYFPPLDFLLRRLSNDARAKMSG